MVKAKFSDKATIIAVITGIVISLVIAMFLSPFASGFPDGLEKVAEKLGFIDKATTVLDEGFFIIPDYSFIYVKSEIWQGPLAGLFGVLIVLAVFGIIFLVYKISHIRDSRIQESK
ncbi:MAG: PDGLE domain-containing protein [Actinobacteria bacterium]|nr:PDGLE domain-containing protein [Actinomycetota bacterium]MBU4450466.1 PDGLE domain-containing protein [Actinomycetota bacterium]MCG2789156.1 PDGLE domain-containing protein [Actinomycetes bacterium]MCG2791627.1 PDGLE domain-containing protein [Actinomycetes bacterium]